MIKERICLSKRQNRIRLTHKEIPKAQVHNNKVKMIQVNDI